MTKTEAKKYLEKNNLLKYLQVVRKDQFEPDYCDLARLHQIAIKRKIFKILEFGIGYSTLILADALRINEEKWKKGTKKDNFRTMNNFKIFSVDCSKKYIEIVNKMIKPELKKYIEISFSEVEAGLFNGRMCHFYKNIPNIVPDLVYLDGPDPKDVKGDVRGMNWQNLEKTVMSGDLLIMEPVFLPGTFIITDGRINNARFLKNNFQRKWIFNHDREGDVATIELAEPPIGNINERKMIYCLGKNYLRKQ